jgi:lysophospholipid acyltransferase (LPLAT)-like uncharacterized protein
MKLRRPWLIGLAALLGAVVIRLWMGTIRYRIRFHDARIHPTDPRIERFLYAFWHEALLFPAIMRTPVHVLISQHRDGELIARVCRHLGMRVVRGSSTRGGDKALLEMRRRGRSSHLGVTPDGPHGPRGVVKLGVVFLASCTGLPIVPVGVAYGSLWRARSWDRFMVPVPWTWARCVVATPIQVPAKLTREGLESYRQLIQERLAWANEAAEHWAETERERRLLDGKRQRSSAA